MTAIGRIAELEHEVEVLVRERDALYHSARSVHMMQELLLWPMGLCTCMGDHCITDEDWWRDE